jgi:hypothetical protein
MTLRVGLSGPGSAAARAAEFEVVREQAEQVEQGGTGQ